MVKNNNNKIKQTNKVWQQMPITSGFGEVQAGESEGEDHPQLHRGFEVSLGCMRFCLKN